MFLKNLLVTIITSLFLVYCLKIEEIPDEIGNHISNLLDNETVCNESNEIYTLKLLTIEELPNELFCNTCRQVTQQVLEYYKTAPIQNFTCLLKRLCIAFTDYGETACNGFVDEVIDFILKVKPTLAARRVCAIYFQHKNCTEPELNVYWNLELPPPPLTTTKRPKNGFPFRILHLTDIHIDPLYMPGSNADCNRPYCCRFTDGLPEFPDNAAGYWGDYRVCDMPWHSFVDLLEHVVRSENFDIVYFTGDIIDHKFWESNKEDYTHIISSIYKLMHTKFKDIPVYPILGNHEGLPSNCFSPTINSSISSSWLYELVQDQWSRWLPKDTKWSIVKGGFYTALVRPGFRIIGLNSNICYTSNFWLMYDEKDPYDQLKWLINVLYQAEMNGEIVHILSHIPPGDSMCLNSWLKEYRKIVDRFSTTIAAQFNGHTHLDEIKFFYSLTNASQIVNVAFTGGSFTTYVGLNPNYRIYKVDSCNYQVLNYKQMTYNLGEMNSINQSYINWFPLYEFTDAYNIPDMSYRHLENLVLKMKEKDNPWILKYYNFQSRNRSSPEECDKVCRKRLVCEMTSVEATDGIKCQSIIEQI